MQTIMKKSMDWKKSIEKSDELKPINILLVDDRTENLLALEAVLDSPNYRLVSAQSGEEALRHVLKEDFAVILLDVQMPGLNGFETAKLIREREKSRHIPIIFITAISQTMEHVARGYAVGAIDYIFKPFQPELLRMKIEGFIRLHKYQEQIRLQSEMLKYRAQELENLTLELQKTEALARAIGETSVDTILTLAETGEIIMTNPAVREMFGYQMEELTGQSVELLLPQIRSVVTATSQIIEMTAQRKDGTFFPVEIHIGKAHVTPENFIVCSIRDITERKQQYIQLESLVAERTQELQKSRDLFGKIFKASPSLIAIRSMEDQRYIDVNESFLQYTGYEYDEVKNLNADRLLILDQTDNEALAGRGIDLRDSIRNAKISYVTKTGEVREGLLSTEIIEIEGEPCVLSVVTDITERCYLEKEMARLDRLNLVGEMAAGIAHEIRNPMTTVRGFLQIAKNCQDIPTEDYIDLMLTELDRANTIITEFLTLAKNKSTDMKKQQLNQIISALFPLVQAEALLSDKGVSIDLQDCSDLYLDEKEIRQLFLNLALNGLEAMEAGGELKVKTYTAGREVILEIADQGVGISEELLEKIWTPFFTTKEQGTGLGLAVCYSVAAHHNARIDVSTSEKGTTFYVRFRMNVVPSE
ncbi:PAS domain S-box protein [Brevibacillus dissolubilis]|uniref:PAS domain S-box protein n=1 Tax=Brevibacillus dissolubilis TaxID=1844116 RepID=UPI00210029D6|nr:PAS domain S-box protein [Brevibacillus dissolubilis]